MRIVHLLNWDLNTIKSVLIDIKNQGFDAIQINPMQPFKASRDFHWWLSYQPIDFTIGNSFGTKKDLKELCRQANILGIKIITDVVCTHMASADNFYSIEPHHSVAPRLKNNPDFWKPQIRNSYNDSRYDMVHYCYELPYLNLKNVQLQEIIFEYLQELVNCGVGGFCFNNAKGIGLPSDGVDFFAKVRRFCDKNNLTVYGEFVGGDKEWQNEFADLIPILTHHSANIYNRDNMVTFRENYDSYLNNGWNTTRGKSTSEIIDFYAELTETYPNTIFYPRPYKFPYDKFSNDRCLSNLNPLECFEDNFLYDPKIKAANQKNKVKTKSLF